MIPIKDKIEHVIFQNLQQKNESAVNVTVGVYFWILNSNSSERP